MENMQEVEVQTEPFGLLIVWNDGTDKVVDNVTDYSFNTQGQIFWYAKDGHKMFVPAHAVRFFGKWAGYV